MLTEKNMMELGTMERSMVKESTIMQMEQGIPICLEGGWIYLL
jgi:hypothetical protein